MAKQVDKTEAPRSGKANAKDADPATGRFRWLKRIKLKNVLTLVFTLIFTSSVVYYLNREPTLTPAEQLLLALTKLDEKKNSQSRELAKGLEATGYHDPSFAGGTEFVLGIVAFREAAGLDKAAGLDEVGREQRYVVAANYLREAENRALLDRRRPEWAYALGVSLYRIGSATEARQYLEYAVERYPRGRIDASSLLAETYLYLNEPEVLQKALELNTMLVEHADFPIAERDRVYLQRAQILMALGRHADAEQAIAQVSKENHGNQSTILLRAQTCMAEQTPEKYQEALELLEPVSKDAGLERTYPRQALYLMGVCQQRLGNDPDTAFKFYEKTAQLYERSHEALAASLWAGDVLRQEGLHEKALDWYGQALRSVRRPENFRNKWLHLEKFREVILQAWNDWSKENRFADAIALSEMMTPLFPRDEAYEYAARANQRWAEFLEAEQLNRPYSERVRHHDEVERRWNRSGQAFARLASSRTASARYPDALWTSSEHYLKGHDFSNAVSQLTRFIETRPTKLLPLALIRKGQGLMNMNRLDEALRLFEQVAKSYPTDPNAFEARYLIGQCRLERQEFELAEKAWRSILSSAELTPNAREWRRSLFSLGKLLFHTADIQRPQLQSGKPLDASPEAEQERALNFARWNEAITSLEQFLDRYPDAEEAREARYLLAKSWQHSAEFLEQKLGSAETENARADLRRKMEERLNFANRDFTRLKDELRKLNEQDQLDTLGKTLLRNCFFELAHNLFALRRYEGAIEAYSLAASRYQLQSGTLTAYVQIANCYDRLGKRAESRSMLHQAKAILNQIRDEALLSPETNMKREDWDRWITWAISLNP